MSGYCPCGSGRLDAACCLPYLTGARSAPTPETLMRSRYTAYVRQDADYLIATWHPDCQARQWREDIVASFADTQWQGLTILAHAPGQHDDEGYVEFAARYVSPARPEQRLLMRERSRFLRLHDRWYYVDGIRPATGRNDPCPCGSGKKYKKCCGQ